MGDVNQRLVDGVWEKTPFRAATTTIGPFHIAHDDDDIENGVVVAQIPAGTTIVAMPVYVTEQFNGVAIAEAVVAGTLVDADENPLQFVSVDVLSGSNAEPSFAPAAPLLMGNFQTPLVIVDCDLEIQIVADVELTAGECDVYVFLRTAETE